MKLKYNKGISDLYWPSLETKANINKDERPENIKRKIPMKQMVITDRNEVYEYFFDKDGINWRYLYSIFGDTFI